MYLSYKKIHQVVAQTEARLLDWMNNHLGQGAPASYDEVTSAMLDLRVALELEGRHAATVYARIDRAFDALTDLKANTQVVECDAREIHDFGGRLMLLKKKIEDRERDAIPF